MRGIASSPSRVAAAVLTCVAVLAPLACVGAAAAGLPVWPDADATEFSGDPATGVGANADEALLTHVDIDIDAQLKAEQRRDEPGTSNEQRRGAAPVGGKPSFYERSVWDFHAAVLSRDMDMAHRICTEGRLFPNEGDRPVPRQAPRRAGKSDEKVEGPLVAMLKEDRGNVLDVLQCLLESKQVPLRASAERPDWFGLTNKKLRHRALIKALTAKHVGAALALISKGAEPQPSSAFLFPLFHGISHTHTLTRTGLFPSLDNAAANAVGASGIREWTDFARFLRANTTHGTPDEEQADAVAVVVDRVAAHSGQGSSQYFDDAMTLTNAKTNILYRAYVTKFGKPWHDPAHNQTDAVGRNIFHYAAIFNNHFGMGDAYLDAAHAEEHSPGILTAPDHYGTTPLQYAQYRGNDEVGHILARLTGDTYERAVSPDKVAERYVAPDLVRSTFETDNAGGWNTDIATDLLPEVGGASRCDIDERNDITAQEFLTEYMLKGKPLALRGYAKNWPFRYLWTRDRLMKRRGHVRFSAGPIPYANAYGVDNPVKNITVREYVETHTGEPLAPSESGTPWRNYVFDSPGKTDKEGIDNMLFYEDLDVCPDFVDYKIPGGNKTNMQLTDRYAKSFNKGDKVQPVLQFFVGPPGSGAPPHFHGDAFNCLAYGAKRWLLGAPRDAFYSKVAPALFIREERGNHPPLMECVQYAGDVLYVPDSWVHTVVNLQDNVGAAIEFDSVLSFNHQVTSTADRETVAAALAAGGLLQP